MGGVEEFRCDSHGDGEVATKLIVRPFSVLGSSVDVLVDSAAVDDSGVNFVIDVFGRV